MFKKFTNLCLWHILKNGVDPSKSRIDDSMDKPKPWQLAEILDPSQCRQANLPDTAGSSTKVCAVNFLRKLFYSLQLF